MEEILKILTDIKYELKEIRNSNDELKSSHTDLMKEFKNLKIIMEAEKKEMRNKIFNLENKMKEFEKKEHARIKKEKKNNIIIKETINTKHFIDKSPREIMTRINGLCKKLTNEAIEVKEAFLLKNNGKNQAIMLAKMKSFEDKMKLMKNKNKLAGTRTYIEDDLTAEELAIQKEIRNYVKEEREKGAKAREGYQKIWLNGKWKKWESFDKHM